MDATRVSKQEFKESNIPEVDSADTLTSPADSKNGLSGSSVNNTDSSAAPGDLASKEAAEGGKKKRRRRRRKKVDEGEGDEGSNFPDGKEMDKAAVAENGSPDDCSSEAPMKKKTMARDKFRTCDNCHIGITERIRVCSGCKKVAYCNSACQKTHWKTHKKVCSYAVQKSELTG